MATLEQYIKMKDGISSPLNKATNATEQLINSQEQLADTVLKSEKAMEKLGAYQDRLGRWHGADGKFIKINVDTEQAENGISSLKNSINDLKSSISGSFILGNVIGDFLYDVIENVASIPGKIIKASDAYSGIMARLNLVTGSQEQAVALNEQIYQSALRARGQYDVMADSVSKIAMTAKEAFPDPKTVVPFMENIQKLFTIGGTDAVHQADALLQLTQALGSGKLQGDELRSIAEAAPLIEKVIADYMGVSMGQIKELGSEGEITAEIIKNAVLGATDEINRQFETIPMKWEDIWTNIQSRVSHAFQPVYIEINKLANTPLAKSLANGIVDALTVTAAAINGVINNVKWLAGLFTDFYNQNKFAVDTVITGFGGAIGVLGLYGIALTGITAKTIVLGAVSTVGKVLQFVTYLPQAITLIRSLGIAQTFAALSATEMWGAILLPIAAVVAAVYVATDGFNNLGTVMEYAFSLLLGMLTAVGIALGGYIAYLVVYNGLQLLAAAYTWMYNAALIISNANLSLAYIRTMALSVAQGLMAVKTLIASGAMAVLNAVILANPIPLLIGLIIAVIGAFVGWQIASNGLRNTLIEVFSSIAEAVANAINFMIEKINGLIGAFNTIKSTVNEIFGTDFSATSEITYRANVADFKATGGRMGAAIYDLPGNLYGSYQDLLNGNMSGAYSAPEIGSIPSYGDLAGGDDGGTAKNTKDTADNTKKIADAMDIMDDDLKLMREMAEQEIINKYTTARVEINLENINNVSSEVDFDGIMTHIGEQIAQAAASGAEAVHI